MSEIRTKPVTTEYEKSWERIFIAGENVEKGKLVSLKDEKVYEVTIQGIAKI